MSASSVILRGYKGGTIVTRGYSLGEAAAAQAGVDTYGGDNKRRKDENRRKRRFATELRELFSPQKKNVADPQKEPVVAALEAGAILPDTSNVLPFPFAANVLPFPVNPEGYTFQNEAEEEMAMAILMLL